MRVGCGGWGKFGTAAWFSDNPSWNSCGALLVLRCRPNISELATCMGQGLADQIPVCTWEVHQQAWSEMRAVIGSARTALEEKDINPVPCPACSGVGCRVCR